MAKNVIYLNSEAYNIGYADGQRDQRKKDIEKAWKWMRSNIIVGGEKEHYNSFIKAMEEEL